MKTISIEIQGLSPLLMDAFTDKHLEGIARGTSAVGKGDQDLPRETAQQALWVDDDGTPCIPQQALWKCIIQGGIFHKQGKKQVTTANTSILPGCITLTEPFYPVKHPKPWEVHTCAIVNSMGSRSVKHRPRFDEWTVAFDLVYDEELIDEKLLRQVIDSAFKRIGIGAHRAERKGPFGKAVVTGWKNGKNTH